MDSKKLGIVLMCLGFLGLAIASPVDMSKGVAIWLSCSLFGMVAIGVLLLFEK